MGSKDESKVTFWKTIAITEFVILLTAPFIPKDLKTVITVADITKFSGSLNSFSIWIAGIACVAAACLFALGFRSFAKQSLFGAMLLLLGSGLHYLSQ